MPSNFAIDGLPIPRPRSPRIFAPRTVVDVEDGIPDIVDDGIEPDGTDTARHSLGKQSMLAPALGVHHSTVPLCDPYDVSPSATFDGLPMEMTMSPAAMFLSAFSPPSVHMPIEEEEASASVDGYTLGPVIGRGGFSTVHRATSPSGDVVAVKVIHHRDIPDELSRRRLANEATVWASLSHEHILPLFRASHTSATDYFFMPLCPAGTLFDILRRDGQPGLPHDDAGMMFRQVVRGVRYLHEQAELVHGDLKLENVLVDASGSCRITDFGMTCPVSHEAAPVRRQRSLIASRHGHSIPTPAARFRAHHHGGSRHRGSMPLPNSNPKVIAQAVYELPSGSLPYAAPELLRVPSPDHPYIPDPAQDVWALGVMLHGLLTGRLPFWDSFEPRLVMKILKGFEDVDMPAGIGRGAELVLRGCLTFSAPRRWTTAAVDEIAWSVGWGADALVDDDIERMIAESLEPAPAPASGAGSRERSRAPDVIYEDEDECAPASPFAASPAVARALSQSRSRSRDPFAHPVLSVSTSTSSSTSRGRERDLARARSRSPSPSMPPATPVDSLAPLMRGRKARAPSTERERPAPYPALRPAPGRTASVSPARRAGSQPPSWALGTISIQRTVASTAPLTPKHGSTAFVLPRMRRSQSVDARVSVPRLA